MMKRISRIGLGLFMIVATILYKPTIMRAVDNSPPNGSQTEELALKKYRDSGNAGIYEITLEVEGFDYSYTSVAPVDVMLVLDRSGSMGGDKLEALQDNAKSFITGLFEELPGSRVGIVSFAGKQRQPNEYWTKESDFLYAADYGILESKIDDLKADGGTHLEGGIYQAHKLMFDDPRDVKKVMIVMADGEPTFGFGWTGNRYYFNFDTSVQVGTGNSSTFYLGGTEYYLKDSVAEMASRARNSGDIDNPFSIYAIGLGVDTGSNAEAVLKSVGLDGYWPATTLNLGDVFDELIQMMSNPVPGGYWPLVTDYIGDEFEWVDFSEGYPQAPQTAHYDDGQRAIIWDLGDSFYNETYILKYKLRIHDGLDGGVYPTNEEAYIEYFDRYEEEVTQYFEVPEVLVPYRVIVEASPSAGGIVSGAGQYEPEVEVKIGATANAGFMFMGWKRVGGDEAIDTNEHSFIMPEADQKWIAYFEPIVEEKPKVYNLTYETNQPSLNYDDVSFEAGDAITPPNPTLEGFEFLGWYVDNDFSAKFEEFASMPARDVIVYADWGEVLGDEDEIEIPEMGDIDIQYYGSMLVLIGLLALIISKKDKTIKR